MAFYENVFVVRQDVASTQVEALADTYATLIQENGGTVTKKEFWGLKGLAYRIRKNRKAHFVLLNIDAPAAAVIELERNMRLNEDVLRYLTVRVEALEEGPSAMMQKRDDRDDRGPRGDRPRRDGRRGFGGGFEGGGAGGGFDGPAGEGDRA
ncbi:MAG: 30S ribosomal protein S6 [Rhodospirillales bacterium]|nr:30S ribosomal protein S6 [Rhodospirillales bacterium]